MYRFRKFLYYKFLAALRDLGWIDPENADSANLIKLPAKNVNLIMWNSSNFATSNDIKHSNDNYYGKDFNCLLLTSR